MESNTKTICIIDGDMSQGGGTERIASVLANSLTVDTNWTIVIISLKNSSGDSFFKLSNSVKHICLKAKSIVSKIFELRRIIQKERVDVIIDVDIMIAIYSIPATFALKTKIVSWEMFNIRNDIGSKHTHAIRQYLLKHGDYYVNQTEGDMNAFKAEMRIKCPITYIHNPIDHIEKYNGYDINSKTIITAGHFYYSKGYDLAIEVARRVFVKHPDWEWRFFGDGQELDKCKTLVCKYQLQNNVLFCGRTQNIIDEYKKSAMYVMTSRTEGFGLVLTEAKAENLPTLAFDCDFGPREIIEEGKSGFLISPFNIEEMANRICGLIENNDMRKAFSLHAKDNLGDFSLCLFTKRWISVIEELF